MLVQTNTYQVPLDKREQHLRLMRKFQQCLRRLGCDGFTVQEQTASNFAPSVGSTSRFVQTMRFRDRRHYEAVQEAERQDRIAQDLIREFCELIDFTAQREQGSFSVDYYNVVVEPTGGDSGVE